MRAPFRHDDGPSIVRWLAVAGLAVTTARAIDDLVRRHDARVVAEHERARKLAKKAKKKARKATKKVAKVKPLPDVVGDRRLAHH
jgi:hypothetical protein